MGDSTERPGGIREPDPTLGKPAQPVSPTVQGPASQSRSGQSRSGEPRSAEPRPPRIRRQRVVLAEPSRSSSALRSRVELEEQTSWGELLIKDLIKVQLRTGLLLALLVVAVLCAFPALFFLVPSVAEARLAGIPVPWLLFGIAPFPLMFGAGLWYNRLAERHERDFVNMIEN